MEQLEKELSAELSPKDQIKGKKVDIFELIDELRASVEASFTLRDALIKRLNEMGSQISTVIAELEQTNNRISGVESLLSSKIIAKSPEQEKQIKDYFKRFKNFVFRYAGHVTHGDKNEEFEDAMNMLLAESNEQKKRYDEVLKKFKMHPLK